MHMLSLQRKQKGLSLLEISIVVLIMALVGVVAMPNLASTNGSKLDNAARQLAEALRFTRAEAIRAGDGRGLQHKPSTEIWAVYRLELINAVLTPVYDIHQPVSKKLYWLDYSSNGNQHPVRLSSATLLYGGDQSHRENISFDKHGTPRYLGNSGYQMLDQASFVLEYDGQTRTVKVMPMTGRVMIE